MKKRGSILGLTSIITLTGIFTYIEYFRNHEYYYSMLRDGSNRQLVIAGLMCVMIPVGYLLFQKGSKNISLQGTLLSSTIGIILFGLFFVGIKDNLLGTAIFALPVNLILILCLMCITLAGIYGAGLKVYRLIHKNTQSIISLDAFIYGFITILASTRALVMTTILYQLVVVLVLIILCYIIWTEKQEIRSITQEAINTLKNNIGFDSNTKTITTILVIIVGMYFMHGLLLAYIPYPTAWDANHAYMYFPKVRAEHHGFLRNSPTSQFSPSPWLTFIALFFQVGYAFQSVNLWIAPDTIAVQMNFFSIVVVMILVNGLLKVFMNYFSIERKVFSTQIARSTLLLWITSGMGAFLLFVDNKSDFGVLSITLTALLLIFKRLPPLTQIKEYDRKPHIRNIIWSGIVAGMAIFSKPTSLFDFATIVILFVGITAGSLAIFGSGLLIMGIMAIMKITTVPLYIDNNLGVILVIIGILVILFDYIRTKNIRHLGAIVLRGGSMLGFLAIVKLPLALHLYNTANLPIEGGIRRYIQRTIMYQDSDSPTKPITLLASTTNIPQSCTLQSQGLTKETLYNNTLKASTEGAGEDLGRYIGYGSKTFSKGLRRHIIPNNTCISIDSDARILCKHRNEVTQGQLESIKNQLNGGSLELFEQAAKLQEQEVSTAYIQQDLIRKLNLYRQDKAIVKDNNILSIPYRRIVPLNITHNRSLQNLSSYYTDIGIMWLLILIMLVYGSIHLLITDPRKALVPFTTLMGRAIRRVSGSAIMRYGVGLIIWSTLSLIILYDTILKTDNNHITKNIIQLLTGALTLFAIIQLTLNFFRIASQGGSGIFVQYKASNGKILYINENLSPTEKTIKGLPASEIFNLQFPHYNKTINAINEATPSKKANLVAGTYMPYFLLNQHNLIQDGFLMSMWEWFSDENTCRSYLRLKDKDLEYLVIDPNIATVAMGDGNITIKDRLFAKIDPQTGKIVQHGAMTMLSKLISEGYIELFSTNNIGAKYAFTLSDEEIKELFTIENEDDIALARTKMATARFHDDGNDILQKVLGVMQTRFTTPALAMSDLADIFGKDVDSNRLATIAQSVSNPSVIEQIKELTQDERYVLLNYLNIVQLMSNKQQFQQSIINILQQSIGGSSQIIVFKVK